LVPTSFHTETVRYLHSIASSLAALLFNLGGILAGALLVAFTPVFSLAPWALLLFPGVLSSRGAIGGLFIGRLSTGLHLGTIRTSVTANTPQFLQLLQSMVSLTVISGLTTSFTATVVSVLVLNVPLLDGLAIIGITLSSMGLSLVVITPITLGVSFLAFRKGWNPDIIVYPIISTVADVLVSFCYFSVLTGYFASPYIVGLIGIADGIFLSFTVYLLYQNRRRHGFTQTVKEFLITMVLVAIIVNVTGYLLEQIGQVVWAGSTLFLVYPALIDTVGDVGAIVGSTATTKLALGTMAPSLQSLKYHNTEIVATWMASLILFGIYALVAGGIGLVTIMATNVLAVGVIIMLVFVIAIVSQKKGWDPDNFVIPIESAVADSVTTLALFAMVQVFR
jgi:mgtE-like transporter